MSRRVTEVVHVGVQGRRPMAFRWRGNRYVVHEVLGHWRERRSWWDEQEEADLAPTAPAGGAEVVPAEAGAGHGLEVRRSPFAVAELVGTTADVVGGLPAPRWSAALAEEYEVWRVQAARSQGGMHAAFGVYDLCHDASARPDIGSWRLLRVVD